MPRRTSSASTYTTLLPSRSTAAAHCCQQNSISEARDGAVGLRVAERSEFVVDAATAVHRRRHVAECLPPGFGRWLKVDGGRAIDREQHRHEDVARRDIAATPSGHRRDATEVIHSVERCGGSRDHHRFRGRSLRVPRGERVEAHLDCGARTVASLDRDDFIVAAAHGVRRSRRTATAGASGGRARVDPPRRAFLYLIGSHVGYWPGVVILYAPASFEPEWRNGSAADL